MTDILLKFASGKTSRNSALGDIADEIGVAFDAVRPGLVGVPGKYHRIRIYDQTQTVEELKAEV